MRWSMAIALFVAVVFGSIVAFRSGNEEMVFVLAGLAVVILICGAASAVCFLMVRADSLAVGGRLGPSWITWFCDVVIIWSHDGKLLPVGLSFDSGNERIDSYGSRMCLSGVEREIRLNDPSGLFHWIRKGKIAQQVIHHPAAQTAKLSRFFFNGSEGENENPSGKASGDLTDSRSYRDGDSVRRILWSAVAKQGGLNRAGNHLMVRSEELVISRRIGIYFFPGGDDDRAAGFTRTCLEKKLLGDDWIFGTQGLVSPIRGDVGKSLLEIDRTWGLSDLPAGFTSFARKCSGAGIGNLFLIADAEFLSTGCNISMLFEASPRLTILAVVKNGSKVPSFSKSGIRVVEVDPVLNS